MLTVAIRAPVTIHNSYFSLENKLESVRFDWGLRCDHPLQRKNRLPPISEHWQGGAARNKHLQTKDSFLLRRMSSSPVLFDSIGLAGYAVGKLQVNGTTFHWMPRQEGDAPTRVVELSAVMRASWSTVGKICHVRLYCKNGDKLRFDGTSLQQKLFYVFASFIEIAFTPT